MSDEQARPGGSRGCWPIVIGLGAFLILSALVGVASLAYLESVARQDERDRQRQKAAEEEARRSRAFPTEVRELGSSRDARARIYGEDGALRFDLGRLRLELPDTACSRTESFRLIIAAPADDRRLTSRSGADFEHRFERGSQRCRLAGLPFAIKNSRLSIGGEEHAIAEGPPLRLMLRPDPEDPVAAVEALK